MRGVTTGLEGVFRHAVAGPTALILLGQQAIAHQGLQHAGDVLWSARR